MELRQSIISELRLLSSPEKQLEYEKSLTTAGHAPSELICGFCDDLFHPKSQAFIDTFTNDELKSLAHLYGLLSEVARSEYPTVACMLEDKRWRDVISLAKEIYSQLSKAT